MAASIGALSAQHIEYYLARYYLELDKDRLRSPTADGQGATRKSLSGWLESEATRHFRLSGAVRPDDFRGILRGSHDGVDLVQNAGKDKRQVGWDISLTPGKSVSLLYAFGTEEIRREVLAAHDAAVRAVHDVIQKELAQTRVGKGGYERERVSIPISAHTHFDSREQDPNLHTHLIIPNVGLRLGASKGSSPTGTIVSKPLYNWKMLLGQLYRNEIAIQLERRLGVEIEIDARTGMFEIKGFAKRLLEGFSTRREQILGVLGSFSYSAKASDAANLETRRTKEHLPLDALMRTWWKRAKALGLKPQDILKVTQRRSYAAPSEERARKIVTAAIERAISKIAQERSHFSRRELLKDVLALTLGHRIDSGSVFRGVDRALEDRAVTVLLGTHKKELHYSTPQIMEQEKRTLDAFKALSEKSSRSVSERDLKATLEQNPQLNAGQKGALMTAALGPDLTIITGLAGVGKTTAQKAIMEALRRSGERVICVAPTNRAVEELRKEATKAGVHACYTVDSLVFRLKRDVLDTLKHHAHMLLRQAFKSGTWKDPRLAIDRRTTIIIDEASMVENPKLGYLIEEAHRCGSRVIVCGDKGQLPAIGRGGMLSELEARGHKRQRSFLSEVIRQKNPWARAAIEHMGMGGDAGETLDAFHRHELVTVCPTRREAMQALVARWAEKGVKDPARHQIFAATNEECFALNELAQARRKAAGELGRMKIKVGRETFYAGDRIVFTETRKKLGIHASAFGTVKSVDPFARKVTVLLDRAVMQNGQMINEVTFCTWTFTSATRGYAVTAHRGQGMTIGGEAYILAGGRTEHREMAYVKLSRAKLDTHVFVDELEAGPELSRLARQFNESRAKLMAHAILRQDGSMAAGHDGEREVGEAREAALREKVRLEGERLEGELRRRAGR